VREFTVVGAEPLLRLLTRQPLDIEPDLGQRPVLPPREPVVPAVGYPIVAGRVRNSDLLDTNIIRAVRAADELAGTSALDVSALLDVGVTSVSAQRIARALLATVPDRSGPVLLERINACEVTGPAWHRAAEAAELFSPAHCSLVEDDLAGVLSGSVERTRHVITALGRVGATSQAEAVAKKADVYTSKLGTCAATALTRMFQASMADGAVGAPIRDAVARTLHGFLLRHPSTAWVLRFDFLTLTPLHADPLLEQWLPSADITLVRLAASALGEMRLRRACRPLADRAAGMEASDAAPLLEAIGRIGGGDAVELLRTRSRLPGLELVASEGLALSSEYIGEDFDRDCCIEGRRRSACSSACAAAAVFVRSSRRDRRSLASGSRGR
jgi:hypothetical protein